MATLIRVVDRFPALIFQGNSRTIMAIDRAAAKIENGAKARSRWKSGAMRGGWQTVRLGAFERIVWNPIHYTIYNEYGTIDMSAQPMLRPSIEETMPDFIREVRHAWYG